MSAPRDELDPPFEIIEPTVCRGPVLFNSPHSGSHYPRAFLEGAKSAYEAIMIAFAKGDRKTLRALLSKEVGEAFERAIAERERNRQTLETTFVSIDKAEIVAVEVRNRVAQITVRFISNLITATRDANGTVIDGSAETVVEVPDIWTFARTLGARDPNWQLVATEAGA